MRAVVGSLLLACAGLHLAQAGPLEDLRATELEYARRVSEQGPAAAWREFLAEDAVLLRPTPVPAREWIESQVWPDGRVTWSPERLEVACSGDLAFGAGPWTYADPQGDVAGGGWSLLLWRRDPVDERWLLVLDQTLDATGTGEGMAQPAAAIATTAAALPACNATEAEALERAEQELNKEIERRGYREALERSAAPGLELLRDGTALLSAGAIPVNERERAKARAETRGLYTTPGADLALTYGEFVSTDASAGKRGKRRKAVEPVPAAAEPDPAAYLRVWRHDGRRWHVVFDSIAAVPPADAVSAP